ncbi:hypothetical protein [Flaviflexus massiliensis]|uniref:hypothetical protein n=1 Tax=Flaviflexus massiliensis TaxID=1522309 RepID=UPI0006D5B408|nr:hypothetical protein [Flaviflexus massiliensis]
MVFDDSENEAVSVSYLINGSTAEQLADDCAVSRRVLTLADDLMELDGVESVLSYPVFALDIRQEVESQRQQALAEVESGFTEAQKEIDALASVDPQSAAVAQEQIDAEKQAAIDQVGAEIDRELNSLLAITPSEGTGSGDEAPVNNEVSGNAEEPASDGNESQFAHCK